MADGPPLDRIRAEYETELSRLGSEKCLLAATDANLEDDAVLAVVADALATGRDRLANWADDVENDALAGALADAAARLDDALDRNATAFPADPSTDAPIGDHLGDPESDRERAAAGLLGLPLVLDPLLLGAVSYFVNEADSTTADRLRDCRAAVNEVLDDDAKALVGDEGADDVVAAAGAVIEAAYAEYADTLAGMGLDPKPIC